jgi:hypothetical protein
MKDAPRARRAMRNVMIGIVVIIVPVSIGFLWVLVSTYGGGDQNAVPRTLGLAMSRSGSPLRAFRKGFTD